jgi:hypothetical protein
MGKFSCYFARTIGVLVLWLAGNKDEKRKRFG